MRLATSVRPCSTPPGATPPIGGVGDKSFAWAGCRPPWGVVSGCHPAVAGRGSTHQARVTACQRFVGGYSSVTILAVAALLVLALISLMWPRPKSDVAVCQEIFRGLATGKADVEEWVDWANLKALEIDVGDTYSKLPDDTQRQQYRQAFIENFAQGFRFMGGTLQAFGHWRLHERAGDHVVVAVDYPAKHKTLLLSLATTGKRRLIGLQWQEEKKQSIVHSR